MTQPLSLPAAGNGGAAVAPGDRSAGAAAPARDAVRARHPLILAAAVVAVGFAAVAAARLLKPARPVAADVQAARASAAAGGPSAEAAASAQAPQASPLDSRATFDEGGDPPSSSTKSSVPSAKPPGSAPKPGGPPRGALPKSGL